MKRSESRFKISRTKSGSKVVWTVSGYKTNGTRIRKRFDTEAEARGELHVLEVEALEQESYKPKITRLSTDQLAIAERAFAMLEDGQSLLDAIAYFQKHYTPPKENIRLTDALAKYEADKIEAGLSETGIHRNVLFIEKLNKSQRIDQISTEQLERLLDGYKAKSFNIYRAVLSSFFTWALKRGYVGENPVNQIPVKPVKRGVPEVYTIEQTKRLLRAAMALHDGALLPYMTLGFFSGIRPEEIQKLSWQDVNLDDGEVKVADHVAKTGRRRVVTLSDNCKHWLRLCWGKDIHPDAFRDKLQEVRMVAGLSVDKFRDERLRKKFNIGKDAELQPWIHDGIRHTAISHHIRAHRNENETALWAGNSRQIIHAHYLSLVTSKESDAFWSITPDNIDGDNVVNMEVSA